MIAVTGHQNQLHHPLSLDLPLNHCSLSHKAATYASHGTILHLLIAHFPTANMSIFTVFVQKYQPPLIQPTKQFTADTGMIPSIYLAIQGAQVGPLFITEDGKHLTRQLFSSNLNTILEKMKIDTSRHNTHSFHIGVAKSAKEAGISDAHIQMLGRWKSQAYLQYIRTPRSQLVTLSKRLVQHYTMRQLD